LTVVVEFEFGTVELMMVTAVVVGRAQHLSVVSVEPALHAEPLFMKYDETSPVDEARTLYPNRAEVPEVGSVNVKSVDVGAPPAGV
jgi:hypothetical protein